MKKTGKTAILFTCVGRRVSLVQAFRKAARSLKQQPVVIGTETTPLSSALQTCDEKVLVRPVTHSKYISELLNVVSKFNVKLIVPTVDLDLMVLAKNKSRFEKLGCCVLVSDPEVISICQDKRKTFDFLKENNFGAARIIDPEQAIKQRKWQGPYFLKPWDGYASRGNAVVKTRDELKFHSKHIPNCIVQEFIEGEEFTCDAYVDFDREVRCVVPRKRIQVRGGEVVKAQIHMHKNICEQVKSLLDKLAAGPGVITIQCFLTPEGKVVFNEINPRFGGGVPLSIKAGANFPKYILAELSGKPIRINTSKIKDRLTMLRYDSEIWLASTEENFE